MYIIITNIADNNLDKRKAFKFFVIYSGKNEKMHVLADRYFISWNNAKYAIKEN